MTVLSISLETLEDYDSCPEANDERPCLHCLIGDLIDEFYAEYGSLTGDVAPFFYPIGIRVWAWVMPSWAVGAAIRGAEPSVERSVADRRAAA